MWGGVQPQMLGVRDAVQSGRLPEGVLRGWWGRASGKGPGMAREGQQVGSTGQDVASRVTGIEGTHGEEEKNSPWWSRHLGSRLAFSPNPCVSIAKSLPFSVSQPPRLKGALRLSHPVTLSKNLT